MCSFITKSKVKYILDTSNKTICGGRIKTPVHYYNHENLSIDCNSIFYLENGLILKTGIIKSFI